MKFRCERDVLGEALATAARAAQGRAGSQPALAGVRLRLEGSSLEISGTDLELTIRCTIDVNGERDGACVVPGRLTAEAVRTLAPWRGDGRRRWRHRGHHVRALVVHRAAVRGRRLPPPGRAGRGEGDGAGLDVPAGGVAGGAGRQQGRVPADPHRRAAHRRGRGPAARRHRLLPPGRVRSPGGLDPRRRAEGAAAVAGAARGRAGPSPGRRDHDAPRGAGRHLRGGGHAGHAPA